MKNEDRNELFLKHQNLINITIRRNRRLITALRLEEEDVKQELSLKMLAAIDSFDISRSAVLEAYIMSKLQYCILDLKRHHKPHGITGVKSGVRPGYVYIDGVSESGSVFEIPSYDDDTVVYMADFLDSLTGFERDTLIRKIEGHNPRKKHETAAIAYIRDRFAKYNEHENEGRKAA